MALAFPKSGTFTPQLRAGSSDVSSSVLTAGTNHGGGKQLDWDLLQRTWATLDFLCNICRTIDRAQIEHVTCWIQDVHDLNENIFNIYKYVRV